MWRVGNDLGLRNILAAPPDASRARIAGSGRHAVTKRARNEPCIPVQPSSLTLRFGKDEAAGCERLRGEIELAQNHRIATAARQLHDGELMLRRKRERALANPVFVFCGRQLIEIEKDVPLRFAGAKAAERRRAPKAPGVLRIFPEVEHARTAPRDIGDVIRPVEVRPQRVTVRRKARPSEALQGGRILLCVK